MNLDGFPLPPLRYISGPDFPVYPPPEGEDTTSWWAHTYDGREIRVPSELIEVLRARNNGVVWQVDYGPHTPALLNRREMFQREMDRVRNELNSLASPQVPPWPDCDLLGAALGIISGVGQGNWDRETTEWQQAARRWLEAYQRHIADSEVTGVAP